MGQRSSAVVLNFKSSRVVMQGTGALPSFCHIFAFHLVDRNLAKVVARTLCAEPSVVESCHEFGRLRRSETLFSSASVHILLLFLIPLTHGGHFRHFLGGGGWGGGAVVLARRFLFRTVEGGTTVG